MPFKARRAGSEAANGSEGEEEGEVIWWVKDNGDEGEGKEFTLVLTKKTFRHVWPGLSREIDLKVLLSSLTRRPF